MAPDQAFFQPAALALAAGGDWEGAVKVIEVRGNLTPFRLSVGL